jgi:hypothetical protein
MQASRILGIFGAGVATATVWLVVLGCGVGLDARNECELAAVHATDLGAAHAGAVLLSAVKACGP